MKTRPVPAETDDTAADQDWCAQENVITYWDAETCLSCGYVWGDA